jgi:hypothetical protein
MCPGVQPLSTRARAWKGRANVEMAGGPRAAIETWLPPAKTGRKNYRYAVTFTSPGVSGGVSSSVACGDANDMHRPAESEMDVDRVLACRLRNEDPPLP